MVSLAMLPLYHDSRHFKEALFPDAHNWTARRDDDVFVFTRGPPLHDNEFVTHGTPLDIAWSILRDGIRVGHGQHAKNGRTMHGYFCMDGGDVRNRIENARHRSTSNRCSQYQKNRSGVLKSTEVDFVTTCHWHLWWYPLWGQLA